MSTPLVITLRENCEYLRDAGYEQTAQLMVLAADEIERLTRELHALQAANRPPAAPMPRPVGEARRVATPSRAFPFTGS